MRSVRKSDWKLVQYDVLDGKVRETQLYYHAENPDEFLTEHHDPADVALTGVKPGENQRDLAKDPENAGKLAEMKALLLEEMRRHDVEGVTPTRDEIRFKVIDGHFLGLEGALVLETRTPASKAAGERTEMSIWCLQEAKELPLPRALVGFALEVIAQRVAGKMRGAS